MDNTDDQDIQTTETGAPPMMNNDGPEANSGPASARAAVAEETPTTDSSANRNTSPSEDSPADHSSPLPFRTSGLLARRQATNPASPELSTMNANINMPDREDEDEMSLHLEEQRTSAQTPDPLIGTEGPLTPRNDAGPFVFDGSAGRSDSRSLAVPNLATVASGESLT
jgi:E3 ubiquitin-protein ligase DMA1/2